MSSYILDNRKYRKVLSDAKHNVDRILEDCYLSFFDEVPNPTTTKLILGELQSPEWIAFTEKVFQKLKEMGCFYDKETGEYDDFEDTAGGCDETTWDVACALIEEIRETF